MLPINAKIVVLKPMTSPSKPFLPKKEVLVELEFIGLSLSTNMYAQSSLCPNWSESTQRILYP